MMSPVSEQSLSLTGEETQALIKVIGCPRSHSEPDTGLDAQAGPFPVKCEISQTGLEQ